MALIDLRVDPVTGDLALVNNTFRLTVNIQEAVRQKVEITLSGFRGEYFANILAFVPYLENEDNSLQLLGKTSKPLFDTTIKAAILEVQGIVSLTTYTSFLDTPTGVLTIDFSAVTESGDLLSDILNITL
jgi:hypothetical protein